MIFDTLRQIHTIKILFTRKTVVAVNVRNWGSDKCYGQMISILLKRISLYVYEHRITPLSNVQQGMIEYSIKTILSCLKLTGSDSRSKLAP